jgi:perosamine synthetase
VPIADPDISEDDVESVASVLRSGWVSGRGKYVRQFEDEFTKWLGWGKGVACTSGTTALHLALSALGVGPGDEVVIPAFSMGAIAFAVSYVGARPVLVDSEWSSWCIDPNKVSEKINDKTKAIIVMHTYGHPCQMGPILEAARERSVPIIEDAAEAHGATYNGKKVGTFGDVSCFSFFANKIITTGEGGMVISANNRLVERAARLRDMAFSSDPMKKFLHEEIGYNYRMTNLQAALGVSQLGRIDKFVGARRKNAQRYNEKLRGLRGIRLPPEAPWAKNVYWMYSVLVEEGAQKRDAIMNHLSEREIETRPFFVPIHHQPVYRSMFAGESYPVAETLSEQGLNLPSGNCLTLEQVEYVSTTLESALTR